MAEVNEEEFEEENGKIESISVWEEEQCEEVEGCQICQDLVPVLSEFGEFDNRFEKCWIFRCDKVSVKTDRGHGEILPTCRTCIEVLHEMTHK